VEVLGCESYRYSYELLQRVPVRVLVDAATCDLHNAQFAKSFSRMEKQWNPTILPFDAAYNDHFETPMQAYLDVKPLLDWFSSFLDHSLLNNSLDVQSANSTSESDSHSGRTRLTLYDPYYCNGRSAIFLKQLGYDVVHEARDFYVDIANNAVPHYDILISNPPYSDTHKIQCLDYCFQSLGSSLKNSDRGKIFLLLMPAYIATKQYFRDFLGASLLKPCDIVYLIPSTSYKYDHPEGTGKDQCPFKSLWFCLVGNQRVKSLLNYWKSLPKIKNSPLLSTTLSDLKECSLIARKGRPNPRKRKRIRCEAFNKSDAPKTNLIFEENDEKKVQRCISKTNSNAGEDKRNKNGKRTATNRSRYRDPVSNVRIKKRF
jgi:hypothetical protein